MPRSHDAERDELSNAEKRDLITLINEAASPPDAAFRGNLDSCRSRDSLKGAGGRGAGRRG